MVSVFSDKEGGGSRQGMRLLCDLGLGLAYSRGELPSALCSVYFVVPHPFYLSIYFRF